VVSGVKEESYSIDFNGRNFLAFSFTDPRWNRLGLLSKELIDWIKPILVVLEKMRTACLLEASDVRRQCECFYEPVK
jgi:hypothetical protein